MSSLNLLASLVISSFVGAAPQDVYFHNFYLKAFGVMLIGAPEDLPNADEAAPKPKDENVVQTNGTIDSVTVYRGQALVTRTVKLDKAMTGEVIVSNLPDQVLPESIYAESRDGVEIRSVRFRERPVAEDIRAEVRELDDLIKSVDDKLASVKANMELVESESRYLERLENFTADTANKEIAKGVLNAETLEKMTDFQFEKRQVLSDRRLDLTRQAQTLNEQRHLLQRKREQLTAGTAKTVREAIVYIVAPVAGKELQLRYLVNNATWSPSYSVRTTANRQQIDISYNASIHQRTGEDWNGIAMTLSTATPALIGRAPTLLPLKVSLTRPVPSPQNAPAATSQPVMKRKAELKQQLAQLEMERSNSIPQQAPQNAAPYMIGDAFGTSPNYTLDYRDHHDLDVQQNRIANELFRLELDSSDVSLAKDKRSPQQRGDEGVSVSYRLNGRISLPSRDDQQLLQIAMFPMKGSFYNLAIPLLTDYVYQEATVVNDSKQVLLEGPVEAYVDGQFVGRGEIPTVSAGETFTLGFGVDSSLRASRELVEKAEVTQGGNRVVTLQYQILLENFGANAIPVRVVDRLPITQQENSIKVTLLTANPPATDEKQNGKREKDKGMLRWDVDVPANSVGDKAVAVDYSINIEFDRQMSLTGELANSPRDLR